MNDRNGLAFGSLLLGMFIGLVIGAAATLMIAPKSGEEIRRDLRQTAMEVRGKAEDTYADVRERAERTAEDVRQKAQETAEDVQKRARM
jgi:gas vesicle protein